MSVPLLLGLGWAAMALVMLALWLVQRATRNAGIVDVAWAFGTGLLGVAFAAAASGHGPRRVLVAGLAGLWGARLAIHLVRRVLGESEDGRYRELREAWGDRTQTRLFWFFQIQATWAVLFASPMLIAALDPTPRLGLLDGLGAGLGLAAIGGEWLADRQLAAFRADPANRGLVCRNGLWRFSRHPNYFFEWLHWWAYALIALGGPWGWLALGGPLVMLLFLTRVTGIPPTERNALRSRGDRYREYQRTTSAFFPWFPREEATT